MIVNELTDARMPAVWPSMSGTASVPDMFAGITLRPAPNSTGVPITTGVSLMVEAVKEGGVVVVVTCDPWYTVGTANLLRRRTRFAFYHPERRLHALPPLVSVAGRKR